MYFVLVLFVSIDVVLARSRFFFFCFFFFGGGGGSFMLDIITSIDVFGFFEWVFFGFASLYLKLYL